MNFVKRETEGAVKFELEPNNRGASDEDILEDIRRCANRLGGTAIIKAQYRLVGRFGLRTIERRLGSWNKALRLAGLDLTRQVGITDEELFENIKTLWIRFGRQPRYVEVKHPESRYSTKPYEKRFGSWSESLRRFVEWASADDSDLSASERGTVASSADCPKRVKPRTRREPSDRQRFRILLRDGFRCRSCGASPLTKPGTELHVDHITPWSKGGETVDENLETKCSRCNLGKGNAFRA